MLASASLSQLPGSLFLSVCTKSGGCWLRLRLVSCQGSCFSACVPKAEDAGFGFAQSASRVLVSQRVYQKRRMLALASLSQLPRSLFLSVCTKSGGCWLSEAEASSHKKSPPEKSGRRFLNQICRNKFKRVRFFKPE